jgi:hypothetical protein
MPAPAIITGTLALLRSLGPKAAALVGGSGIVDKGMKVGGAALNVAGGVGGAVYGVDTLMDWTGVRPSSPGSEERMSLAGRSSMDKYALEGLLDEGSLLEDEKALSKLLSGLGEAPDGRGTFDMIGDMALQEALQREAPQLQAAAERRARMGGGGLSYQEVLDRMGVL